MLVGTRWRLTALGLVEHLSSWFFGGLYIPSRTITAGVAWRGVWMTTLVLFLLEAGPCRAAWRLYLSLGAVSCGTYLAFRCICLVFYRLLVPNSIPPDRQLRSLFEIWTFFSSNQGTGLSGN